MEGVLIINRNSKRQYSKKMVESSKFYKVDIVEDLSADQASAIYYRKFSKTVICVMIPLWMNLLRKSVNWNIFWKTCQKYFDDKIIFISPDENNSLEDGLEFEQHTMKMITSRIFGRLGRPNKPFRVFLIGHHITTRNEI